MAYPSHAFEGDDHDDQFNLQPQVQVHGTTDRYERSLIPCTIRQIVMSPEPGTDEAFRIDGIVVHQISVIATVKTITPNSTHTLFMLEDRGPCIQAKLWSSSNQDIEQLTQHAYRRNDLVKVIGKVDVFNHVYCINIHHMEKVVKGDEVTLHYLEAIFAHQLNTVMANQHIGRYKQQYDEFLQHSQSVYQGRAVPMSASSPQRAPPSQYQHQHVSPMHSHNQNQSHSYLNSSSSTSHTGQQQQSLVQPSPLQHQQRQQPQQYQYQNGTQHSKNNNNNGNVMHVNSNVNDMQQQQSNLNTASSASQLASRLANERPLNSLEKNILGWMKMTAYGHKYGHKREAIKAGLGVLNWTTFNQAIMVLHERGHIFDAMEDCFRIDDS